MNPFATHQPTLFAACRQTDGPIVELGVGEYSTIPLHEAFPGRIIVSVEYDWEWLYKFKHLANATHFFALVRDFTHYELPVRRAGVVFVDCDPALQRQLCVRKYADQADFIVVHDTEPTNWQPVEVFPGYGWGDCFDRFKYRWDDTTQERWTTVVSNVREFKPDMRP